MSASKFIIQSTLLLFLITHIKGKKTIYFSQSKIAVLKCDIDLSEVRILSWYDKDFQDGPVASYNVRNNSIWSENDRYVPTKYQLTVRNVTDGQNISCINPLNKEGQEFFLQRNKPPNFTLEIMNCPDVPVEKNDTVILKCTVKGYYPNGSVHISWDSTGDICLKTNEISDCTVTGNKTFSLSSSIAFKVSENQTVTCRLDLKEPTTYTKILGSVCEIQLEEGERNLVTKAMWYGSSADCKLFSFI
ncbi:uncharacterized protein LOC117109251 isoform X2 [Anneissia japonica]|uniref:uncharacterized protein LOC117109251 isoform X2 n=1 Tax=Anneissia japonica TaxID=1529436 RepID=UPI0014255FB1|nr:uncharacterized protein LOC117109251 isoform X2 [Anneissia japonica]